MRHLSALFVRYIAVGVAALAVTTLLTGVAYPLAVTAVAQVVPDHRVGRVVTVEGRPVGAAGIGQDFSADPSLFQGRPTNEGAASNLAPTSAKLKREMSERRLEVAARENVAPGRVPADAITVSGSGMDPDISPAYARLQIPRVARANGLDEREVARMVEQYTTYPLVGIGTTRVNVVELNAALARKR
ncbi:MAG: potassium-transporting ATPase subunit C [Actinomycetaceae bacterium]|nr:potassium-transporting ATPase subunit C [Actinomycetaceae bacterium]